MKGSIVESDRDLNVELRDDLGGRYAWRAATSGGVVLPEEVTLAFDGVPDASARLLELLAPPSGDVLMSVALPAPAGATPSGAIGD